ncbi:MULTISPECIES: SurA N-terminal domain-containing protein [unclassified Polaromonas]|uniref:SurA N-terminal domain-containing protein n=1 Tax=unclassified Polaromonas TaxID=2638319 RepID=UPI000F07F990|nr:MULTISPECIES: SurA N-terminal domain-containing protein [unclassified Polaromonas]AYQ29174.1 peptidyl-prolyl cis-trans isomerase [Polaromonas sp. SP1]QGJ19711.1 peptidyl-prolyl cis-trans isomerase [Polaromonas sp. Pch-P]
MFDFIRKHTKVTMALLFLLIVPSFILFGLDGYNQSRDKGAVVAKVDGKDIIQSEWDQAHQREVERLRVTMPSLDPKLLDSPEARYTVLERLVRDRVIAAAADKFKLATSDQRLARELQQTPEIASLRRPDGSLDMDRYRALLANQGMSPEMFEANLRADLSNRQVLVGIGASGFSANAAADMALNAYFEKREVQLARFSVADFAAKLSPTDADLEQFYKTNEKLFQAPEQASIEYVQLDLDSIKKGLTVNEADLKTYYEQNAQRLSGTEERRASHILIASPKTAPAADREKARAKAQELLALVKKSPDTFADVARKNSQDPGSAPNGGDLDFFARGSMVKPFEDAAFSMKKGDISDVVESEFGYHVIKLTDVKAPKQRSFEEMKPELEAELKKQQAQKKFSETADAFTNGVYEQSDSLKPVAERLKLEIKSAARVTRQPEAGATGVLANPKFLGALFAADAVEKKRNTEAIEVAPNQLVSGRIVQHTPARTQPFAEVKDQVRQRWLAQRGAEEARKEGTAKLAAWKAAPASATGLSAPVVVSREQTQQLPPPVIDAALRVDGAALPGFAGVDLGTQGYAIVKVDKVVARDVPVEAAAKQQRNQYAQWWTSAESLAYYNGLKERFKAEILVAKPAPDAANAQEAATR